MSGIADLENRISAAMERIGHAVQSMDRATGVTPEELEQARTAFEAAEERTRLATEKAAEAEAEIARLQQALEAESAAAAQLRERVGALKSMKDRQQERIDELEAEVRTTLERRIEDRAELDGLIAALEPLVKEASDA